MRASRYLSNHSSRESWLGRLGTGGMAHTLRSGFREGQSVLDEFGLGSGGEKIGWEMRIIIGMLSEPVEGGGSPTI